MDPLGRLDAVGDRHLEIHEHDVGRALGGQRGGFLPVRRLADELDVGERQQELLESVADDRMVVGDEDADHEIGTSDERCSCPGGTQHRDDRLPV